MSVEDKTVLALHEGGLRLTQYYAADRGTCGGSVYPSEHGARVPYRSLHSHNALFLHLRLASVYGERSKGSDAG
jgi:hypothetical protein